MSFQLPTQRTSVAPRARWSGAAFLVEAMLLLVFVMASLAVLTQMFAASSERANQSGALTDAVAVASATAERFSADPTGVEPEETVGDMRVICQVTPESRPGGTMYRADISVYASDADPGAQPIYTVSTSKYESGV